MPKIDCACVIHGDRYDWRYVENLYAMVSQNLTAPVTFHVFTEASRSVPDHMIKHSLLDWPQVSGSRRAWWYKMQMFDPRHGLDRVLYFDLDVVITANLDWITALAPEYFWAIHDWRRFWKPHWQGINSSMMIWNQDHAAGIWKRFRKQGLDQCVKQYQGDQDFITDCVPRQTLRYFDEGLVHSWRWQIRDGGLDPKTRKYARPGAGSVLRPGTAVMIFHGKPKPHEVQDPIIQQFWHQ